MTTRLNVGVSRKVGQPHYGSLGACCHVDIEIDQQTVADDPQGLQRRIEKAFAICRQAVEAELNRSGSASGGAEASSQVSGPHRRPSPATESPRAATAAQVKAIHAIAGRLGVNLSSQLEPFGVRSPSQLTLPQASRLIDQLKASLTPTPA